MEQAMHHGRAGLERAPAPAQEGPWTRRPRSLRGSRCKVLRSKKVLVRSGVFVSDPPAGSKTEKTWRQLVQLPPFCGAVIMTCQVMMMIIIIMQIIIVRCTCSTL